VWELYCSLSICLNLFWFRVSAYFTYEKTVINPRRVEKSAFEDQSEFSVNNKMNDFVGNILQNKFHPYCYILLSGTRRCTLSVALLWYLGATGVETSLLLTAYCIE